MASIASLSIWGFIYYLAYTQLLAYAVLTVYPSAARPWHRQLLYFLVAIVLPGSTSEALDARLEHTGPRWLRRCIVPIRILSWAALSLGLSWLVPTLLYAPIAVVAFGVVGFIVGGPIISSMLERDLRELQAAENGEMHD